MSIRRFHYRALLLVTLVLSGPLISAAEPTAEEIDMAVRQLGDDSFAVREKATQLLWKAGAAAEPALLKAVKDPDAEVVLRAAALLDRMRWGIFADTPTDVVALVKVFREAGDDAGRQAAMRGLLAKGSQGLATLRKIATADATPGAREAVENLFRREASSALPALLAEEKYDDLETLAALAAASRDRRALQDYTAVLMMRGRVEAKIDELKARADDPATAQLLAYLYRAKGDPETALTHARKAGDDDLIDTLLFLRRDWAALRERLAIQPEQDQEALGMLLTCQLRTGRKTEAEHSIAALRKIADDKPVGDGSIWQCTKPLFLNELTEEAMKVLPHGCHYPMMFDVLVAQVRFREALELVDQVRAKKDKNWMGTTVRQVRLLRDLGEIKKADALLDELIRTGKEGEEWGRRDLIALLFEVGRKDEAFAKVEERVTANAESGDDEWLWSTVFSPDERGHQAVVWWKFLRSRDATQPLAETLKALRAIMDDKADPKLFAEALRWARTLPHDRWPSNGLFVPLADWCGGHKLLDQRRECLAAEIEVRETRWALMRLGDHDAAEKKWREAAESFHKAWELERADPVPLWKWGQALEQAGAAREGARLMERARWLALGNDVKRFELGRAMQKAGRSAEGLRERTEMNGRLSLASSWYLTDAVDEASDAAADKGDWKAATEGLELATLSVIENNRFYLHDKAYMEEPARVRYRRGRGLLAAAKVEEALAEARAGLKLLPGDVEVTITYARELDKLGKNQAADELFEQTFAVYAKLLKEFPDWSRGLNDAAWLCGRCRRHLDEALAHAEKAVEREPERTAYLDTLAEVHFQRGDMAKAVELMKRCVEKEPDREYYRKQLKRFEAGDPDAQLPDQR